MINVSFCVPLKSNLMLLLALFDENIGVVGVLFYLTIISNYTDKIEEMQLFGNKYFIM